MFFERKNFSPKCGGDRIGTTKDKEGSCSKALLHILSPNKHFEDRFLEKYISAKDTIFIASAASLPAVPDVLRQGFSVIELPEYNGDELVRIAQKFLIPRRLKESGIQADAVIFPDETLMYIADQYCQDYSVGRMKQLLRKLINEVPAQQNALLRAPYSVSRNLADFLLKQDVNENAPRLICHRNCEKYAPTVLAKLQVLSKNRRDMDFRRERSLRKTTLMVYLRAKSRLRRLRSEMR